MNIMVTKGTTLAELKIIIEKLLGADKLIQGLCILKQGNDVDAAATGKEIEDKCTLMLSGISK